MLCGFLLLLLLYSSTTTTTTTKHFRFSVIAFFHSVKWSFVLFMCFHNLIAYFFLKCHLYFTVFFILWEVNSPLCKYLCISSVLKTDKPANQKILCKTFPPEIILFPSLTAQLLKLVIVTLYFLFQCSLTHTLESIFPSYISRVSVHNAITTKNSVFYQNKTLFSFYFLPFP